MRAAAVLCVSISVLVVGCASMLTERTNFQTFDNINATMFEVVWPANGGPREHWVRNDEAVPICVGVVSHEGMEPSRYFLVAPGKEQWFGEGILYHGLRASKDLSKC